MNYRRIGRWAAAGAGLAGVAAAGLGVWWLKERRTERPSHETLVTDGAFEIRRYPALITAETVQLGARDAALGAGFGVLADYIFAGSREGRELPMTVPVIHQAEDGAHWRTRFVMPHGETAATLPAPGKDVAIADLPPRRIAVLGFSGGIDDRVLAEKARALAAWLAARGEAAAGPPEFAVYNSPFLPSPLRRNEVWLALTENQ